MMNVENLNKLTDFIENHPSNFCMETFGNATMESDDMPVCGTIGCVGGWAEAFQRHENLKLPELPIDPRDWLGLTNLEAGRLFYTLPRSIWDKYATELGLCTPIFMERIKPHHAVMVLRKLASGEWNFIVNAHDPIKEQD